MATQWLGLGLGLGYTMAICLVLQHQVSTGQDLQRDGHEFGLGTESESCMELSVRRQT